MTAEEILKLEPPRGKYFEGLDLLQKRLGEHISARKNIGPVKDYVDSLCASFEALYNNERGDYYEGVSEGVKVGRKEMWDAVLKIVRKVSVEHEAQHNSKAATIPVVWSGRGVLSEITYRIEAFMEAKNWRPGNEQA